MIMVWIVLYLMVAFITLIRTISRVVDDYNSHKVVFTLGPAEFVGAFPVRQDITVIPADDPKRPRTNLEVLANGGEVRLPKYHINDIDLIKEQDERNAVEDRNLLKRAMSSSHRDIISLLHKDVNEEIQKEQDAKIFEHIYTAVEEAKEKE